MLVTVSLGLVILVGLKYWQLQNNITGYTAQDIFKLCLNNTQVSYHIHPQIQIFINDKPLEIPANIGNSQGCMRVIHTHNDLPKIHIESPIEADFTLKDFFNIWGKPLSKTEVLDYNIKDGWVFKFLEDEKENFEPETIILKDNKIIKIYISKAKEKPDNI